MLMESAFEPGLRRVAVQIETPGFARVLGAVLDLWGYEVVTDATAAGLLLVEQGGGEGEELAVLRLNGASGCTRLALPLALEALWGELEQRFHHPARQHIRVALSLAVGVVGRHRYAEATLQSLSDMGGRLLYPRELVREEGLLLRIPIDHQVFELSGKVIYCFPRGTGAEFEVGILFQEVGVEVRQVLRQYIGRQVLGGALAKAGVGADAGLAMFRPY